MEVLDSVIRQSQPAATIVPVPPYDWADQSLQRWHLTATMAFSPSSSG